MAFSIPLSDNSTLMLGEDDVAIKMALADNAINLDALGFPKGEYPDFEEFQIGLQKLLKRLN